MKSLFRFRILIGIVFALSVLCICMVAFADIIADGSCGDNLAWTLDSDGVLTISGIGEMVDYSTDSTEDWRQYKNDIYAVILQNRVTSIGAYAFYQCNNLMSISIPESINEIGDYAFSFCSTLPSISFPDNIIFFSNNAFYKCGAKRYTNIESVTALYLSMAGYAFDIPEEQYSLIYLFTDNKPTGLEICNVDKNIVNCIVPDGVTSIGAGAFGHATQLATISMPNTLTCIQHSAFYGCNSLTEIIIPDSVTTIDFDAFTNCINLINAQMSNNISFLGGGSFAGCSSLNTIEIPGSLRTIAARTFYQCSNLENVTISNGVTTINDNAFYGCCSIINISLPNSLTSIGTSAFYGCNGLVSIQIPCKLKKIAPQAFKECSGLQFITISEGVTSIGKEAFYGCYNVSKLEIPSSVSNIDEYAFYGCYGLKKIRFSSDISSIGDYAFSKCTGLINLSIPGISNIGAHAFADCSGLKQISFMGNVTNFGEYAFSGCQNLMKVIFLYDDFSTYTYLDSNVFPHSNESYYCNMDTDTDYFCYCYGLYPVIYLGDTGVESVRTITIENDFWLICDNSKDIDYDVFPDDGATIIWSSSAPAVVSVENGHVTALSTGKARISIKCGTVTKRIWVYAYIPASEVHLNESELWIQAMEDVLLSVTYTPTNASAKTLTWNSSNSQLATVALGKVSSIRPGDVVISATTEEGITDNCQIHITYPVKSVIFDNPIDQMLSGENYALNVTVTTTEGNTYTNKLVSFESSDDTIATVDNGGIVTAKRAGNVTITATSTNGKTDSITISVICSTHIPIIVPGTEPTCEEAGYTESSYCAICGGTIQERIAIQPKGHDWGEATYTWANDNNSVTATRVCRRDTSHIETETVEEITATPFEATCTEKGGTIYTSADFTNTTFSAQTKTVEDIDALGHDWGETEYTWADDHSSVTATRSCSRGDKTETETVTEITAKSFDPTCTEKGGTTYTSAAFENEAFTAQTETVRDADAIGHDWGETTYEWAADNSSVTAKRICSRDETHVETETVAVTSEVTKEPTCTEMGETTYTSTAFENEAFAVQTKTKTDISALGHDWGETAYTWADDHSSVTATRSCSRGDKTETETVTEITVTPFEPTCTEKGGTVYTSAAFENEAFAAQTETVRDVDAIGHDWGETTYEWSADNTKVTATRVCGHDASHVETETVNATSEVTKAATCEAKGETTYTGAAFENTAFTAQTKTEEVPALGHDWGEPVYTWADDHSSVTATRICAHDAEHVETETVEEITAAPFAATCTEKGGTKYTSGAFVNAAFTAQTMTVTDIPARGHTLQEHEKAAAMCTEAGTEAYWECTACGKLFSDPDAKNAISKPVTISKLGHAWNEPTYTWNADYSEVTATRICSRDESHKQTETVKTTAKVSKAATCTAKGQTTYTATFTNAAFTKQTRTVSNIAAKGHTLKKHTKVAATCTKAGTEAYWECTVCGKLFSDAKGKNAIAKPVIIAKLGHKWGAVEYTWSEDLGKVTATRVCANDNSHKETETVATTCKTTEATTKQDGKKVYTTKAFKNSAFKVQTKTVVIPKYPATYSDKNCKYKIKDDLTAVVTGPAKDTLTKVTIPDTITVQGKVMKVTGIADKAFKGLKKLKTVIIGKNVKDIGKNAFSGCGKLKTITINSELLTKSSVKGNAFKGIHAKATIKVPKAKKKEYAKFLYKKGVPKTAKIK